MKTQLQSYRIDWTNVGATYVGTFNGQRQYVKDVISRMQWDFDYKGKSVPMMPGLAIKSIIQQMRLPKVSAVCYTCHEMAPYGFYGIEANYTNGRVRVHILDIGTECVPLCMYVWDN